MCPKEGGRATRLRVIGKTIRSKRYLLNKVVIIHEFIPVIEVVFQKFLCI
jgi:hypothetical protein